MHMAKKIGKIAGLSLGLLIGGVALFLAGMYVGFENRPAFAKVIGIINKEPTVATESNVDFEPFWKAWSLINEKFPGAEKINDQERLYGAISGLVASLGDPYTVFFPPEENKEFNEQISGEFSGVGIEIGEKNGVLTVIAPLKDTPAFRAGVQAGDQIAKIDSAFTADMSIDEAIKLIRGEPGSLVTLTIVREGAPEPKAYTMNREKITLPTVDTEFRQKEGVFIIHLYNFSAQSPSQFKKALQEFADSGSAKLVLDLRNNPGGYLEAAVNMASWFLPEGKVVVKEIGKSETDVSYHNSKGPGLFAGKIKMVVLVNGGSASASEILAGALNEQGAATLMGQKTFGKGSVQELVKLTKDTSLKVTVAKWYTPKGISISDHGLTPDIIVEQKRTENDTIDEQLEAAVSHLIK